MTEQQEPDSFYVDLGGRTLRFVKAGDGCFIKPGHMAMFTLINDDHCLMQECETDSVFDAILSGTFDGPNCLFVPPDDFDELVVCLKTEGRKQ